MAHGFIHSAPLTSVRNPSLNLTPLKNGIARIAQPESRERITMCLNQLKMLLSSMMYRMKMMIMQRFNQMNRRVVIRMIMSIQSMTKKLRLIYWMTISSQKMMPLQIFRWQTLISTLIMKAISKRICIKQQTMKLVIVALLHIVVAAAVEIVTMVHK